MAKILPLNDTTYEVEMPSGDKVEIGDREAIDFKPHLKLNHWGGECFVKVGLPTTEKVTPIVEAGKVKWRGQKVKARFYPLEPTTQNELGGFEFEIVLKEKPATNQIVLDIDAKGLRFSYQPPLTQQEIDNGTVRPDNVVGSYAVYHATKKNNEYMTGKAFHIYRPSAEDALGNKAWCSLYIDGHIDPTSLTLTVPQQFLDEATYPVVIDPTFGRTSIGGTSGNLTIYVMTRDDYRRGSAWTMPPPGGTANFISAYIGGDFDCDCKVFINQKDSGGAGTHGQIATKAKLACGQAFHWETFTLGSEELTAAVVYILNIIGNADDAAGGEAYYIKYDDDSVVASYYDDEQTYGAPESPWESAPEGTTRDYSIYCDYSEAPPGWTGKISGVVNPAKVMGVPVANIAKVKGVA